jgi:hypothetical protein
MSRYFVFFAIIGFIFCIISPTHAQMMMENDKGEKIVVYPDGSWKYADQAKESAANKSNTPRPINKNTKPIPISTEQLLADKNSTHQLAVERTDYATNEVKRAILQEQEATRAVTTFESEIAALKKKKAAPTDIKAAEQRLKYATIKVKDTKEARKKTEKTLEEAKKALENATKAQEELKIKYAKEEKARIEAQNKALAEAAKKAPKTKPTPIDVAGNPQTPIQNPIINNKTTSSPTAIVVKNPTKTVEKPKETKPIALNIVYKEYSPAEDVMLNPPKSPCRIASDQYDDFSAKRRRETKSRTLFTYTNEALRSVLKEKEFLTCEASMIAINNTRTISLNFTIASDMAQREFGSLERGGKLLLYFVNGKVLELQNQRTDAGKIDGINRTTNYQLQCPLDDEAIKTLSKNELDRVRVTWSTGHEEYEVYDLDLFADQLACLAR